MFTVKLKKREWGFKDKTVALAPIKHFSRLTMERNEFIALRTSKINAVVCKYVLLQFYELESVNASVLFCSTYRRKDKNFR